MVVRRGRRRPRHPAGPGRPGRGQPPGVTVWAERQALLEAWLDDVEPFVLAGATHLLHLQRPRAMAEALAGFFARHPLRGL
ncbi:MAG: hypothetical protein M3O65_05895 [Actinomycetota bacterium]|nr:hypothetical protein [Actinomycetota bacterium]